jgi:hypothetical protein
MSALPRWCLAAVLLSATSAQAQTTLAWKLPQGQAFEMERTATQDQAVELRGKMFKQHAVSTWRVRFEVQPAQGENLVLRATLKDVQHKVKGAVGPGVENSLADKLQGRQFTLKLTPQGKIVGFEGYADFVTEAAEKQPERAKALRTLLPEEALREAFADLLGPLPAEAVRAGATWQHRLREPIPHFGTLQTTWQFTAEGPAAAGYHLAYTIKTTYQAPAADEAPLLRVVKGSLQGENGRGKIDFDVERGRLLRHERRQSVRGNLTVETMGMQVPLEFASENVLVIRAVD